MISLLLRDIKTDVAVGPGDDAAAIDLGGQFSSPRPMSSRTAHLPKGMTDWQIGWFAAAVNFSDIAAMGARPLGLLLANVLPRNMPFEDLQRIVQGAQDCAGRWTGTCWAATPRRVRKMVIAGTALGLGGQGQDTLGREGAREEDRAAVTGPLGLARSRAIPPDSRAIGPRMVRKGAVRRATAMEIRAGMVLTASGKVDSCMDISTTAAADSTRRATGQRGSDLRGEAGALYAREDVDKVRPTRADGR